MLELAVDRSRAAGLPVVFPVAASTLGLAHALAGRHADAVALLDEAVARAGSGWSHALPFACLAEGYFLAGRADEAEREAERALDLARAKGERGIEAWILRLLGEIGSGGDAPRAAALDAYRAALALAAEFDMQPLAALCHLGMGKLHRRIGPPERAREHLDTAVAMLRSMGMRLWLDDAETSLARL
jgi:tetratricopeptide (TPR) repeat protein